MICCEYWELMFERASKAECNSHLDADEEDDDDDVDDDDK